MNISKIDTRISFRRALTTKEEQDFRKTTSEAKKVLQIDDGISLFKVFQYGLPQGNENTGIGKLNSDEAMEYLKFMKLYTGANSVKIFPLGQFPTDLRSPHYYCPYERGGTTIGEDNINLFKLKDENYGNLLSEKELKENCVLSKKQTSVDFENELDKRGNINRLLKIAYKNLNEKQDPSTLALKEEFEEFKKNQKNDSLDRLGLAPFIKTKDRNLFKDFATSKEKQERFEVYKKQYEKEIDFYKFGKFLALKNLKEAKENLNNEGLELFGDCPIGFNEEELIAYNDAFYPENYSTGWNFRAPKFDELKDENSEVYKLLSNKFGFYMENFDGIRFDVGWLYISPRLFKDDEPIKIDVGNDVTDFIENLAKKIKGDDYDTSKLLYECDAGADDFQMFDWEEEPPKVLDKMKGKTAVLTTVYENADGYGWGNPQFLDNSGMENYIIGTNNHDSTPLRMLAESKVDDNGKTKNYLHPIKADNKKALKKSLGVDDKFLSDPKNFVKAKFAEIFLAKNQFLFFNDVMGNKKRTDEESSNPKNYRIKISNDYESQYHSALQDNRGFNLAQSLKMALKAKKLDKTNPALYRKLDEYSKILSQKGVKTKEEADKRYGWQV